MFASVLIIVLSSALLAYWFRYSCILLLRNLTQQAPVLNPAMQGTFSFGEIRDRLQSGAQMDPLHGMLQRDYQVLTYLVRHASGVKLESFEEKLLIWDYTVMRFWYALTKTAAPDQARQALGEMVSVLSILAGRIGQRTGVQSEA
jgi:hypothetical protein